MEKINLPELTLAEIMLNIRAQAQPKPPLTAKPNPVASPALNTDDTQLTTHTKQKPFSIKTTYTVADFCQYHDKAFIINVFRAILKRDPDEAGMEYYLSQLRTGKKTKREIIANARFSKEGRAKKVKIQGVIIPFLVALFYHLPVLGYLLKFMIALLKLPKLVEKVHQLEAQTQAPKPELAEFERHFYNLLSQKINREELEAKANRAELELKVNRAELELKANRAELELKVDRAELELKANRAELDFKIHRDEFQAALENKVNHAQLALKTDWKEFEQHINRLDIAINEKQIQLNEKQVLISEQQTQLEDKQHQLNQTQVQLSQLNTLLAEKQSQLNELTRQVRDHKLTILDNQRRLQLLLEEARKRLPKPFSPQQVNNLVKEQEHLSDAMYIAFEDKFRGTRADIKKRQAVYLPAIETAIAATARANILDVGCGRGEWLELLQEQGIKATGLDLNSVMIQECQERGLEAQEREVIAYLRTLPSNSLAAITGFHIIEHLPFKVLINLFDEALRVLKPGGIVVFETPNPENLMVGAFLFYTDPSHVNPLVPETTKFLLEERGFFNVKIMRLHKYSDYYETLSNDPFVIKHFYNEMDFGVIGCKM